MNFSRTCWITFIDSSVSVIVPQHWQLVGPGTITRSRGKCSGKGLREGIRPNHQSWLRIPSSSRRKSGYRKYDKMLRAPGEGYDALHAALRNRTTIGGIAMDKKSP